MSLFSSTATSTSSIPQQVAANYNTAVTNAGAAASQPWQQYSADPNAFVAGLNTTQQAGIANTNASAGQAQPYFNAAQSALGAGVNQAMPFVYGGGQDVNAQQIGGQQIGQFMSPYLGSVYSAMLAGQGQQNAQQQSNLKSGAIGAGAFGGDRAGIGQANLAYQQNLANAQTNANMLNTGYGQALGAAQQQQGVNLGAQQANRAAQAATGQSLYGMGMGTSQQLGALGTGAQTAGLQGAAAQMGAGAAQQKTSQDALTAMYNQFLQSQAYPFQTSQFYTNAVTSLGPLFGGTTTTQTPGLFAARGGSIRGAYAGGGLIPSSMGGGVGYEHAGEGYADGGMPGGWSDYFQNALGASGFSPPTTYTPAPNQGGYTQAPGQSAYTQTQHPVYSQAPSGLGAAAAADYGNIFGNLSHNTAAPSAQQQYSDSQLPNIARLRSPLVHAPEVKKDDTANPVAAPSGLAGMPYAGTSESGVGGAGQNMGANAPHGGTGSFMGDVTGMRNALGDFFSGGTGWGGNGATINASMQTQDKSVYDAMDKAAAEPAGSQVEPGSQGDSGYGGAGDHEARGGRIHRAYGGLNLSTADLANMQAMQTENSGLFPGAPQGYKPPVDKRMQPGLGHASIPQQWHISQVRFPRPAAPSSSSNTVGGLINDFSGAKDFYNNVSGDNPDYLNAAKTASSALGLATGGTADRGHYSTAGGVYSSEGRESAIPGYSPELGIPDVLTPPQQRASNAPASSGGGGGGGLGDVLKIAGAVLPFLLKRGGAVGERHEYADGGLAGGRHGYAEGGGGPDEDTLAQPNGPFDFSQGMTNQPVGAKMKRAISAIKDYLGPQYNTPSGFAPTSGMSGPPMREPEPEQTTHLTASGIPQSALGRLFNPYDPKTASADYPTGTSETGGTPETVFPSPGLAPAAPDNGDSVSDQRGARAITASPSAIKPGVVPETIPNNAFIDAPSLSSDETTGVTNSNAPSVTGASPKAPASGLNPEPGSGASPFQKLQSEPLSWVQRNQDLIGAIGGGLEGMGRGKTPFGALLGGAGGAARGYIGGQKALSAQAFQEAQTQREAAGANQANVQTAEIPANAATNRFVSLATTHGNSLKTMDGRLFAVTADGQFVPFGDWDPATQPLLGGAQVTQAAAALKTQFPQGAFSAGSGSGNIEKQDYNALTRQRESGSPNGKYDLVHTPGDPNGAYGAYGFRKNTWEGMRPIAAQQGVNLPDFETLKTMPASQSKPFQDQAQSIFTQSNAKYLTDHGIEASKGALATAHYQGPAGAVAMLSAPPMMTVEGYANNLPGMSAAGKQSVVAQLHAQGVYNMGQAQQMAQQGWMGRVGQGGGATVTNQPSSLSPAAQQQAQADAKAVYGMTTQTLGLAASDAAKERTVISDQAREARTQGPVINEFAKAIATLPSDTPLAGGPLNQALIPVASYANSLARAAGFSPEKNPELFFNPGAVDAKTFLDKLKITAAAASAQSGGERSYAALSALERAIPSGDMTKTAANHLLSTMYVNKQRAIDEDKFYQSYNVAAKNQPLPGNASRLFPTEPGHASQDYENDRVAVERALNANFLGKPLISSILTGVAPNGKKIPPDVINAYFGRNVAQYILNQ